MRTIALAAVALLAAATSARSEDVFFSGDVDPGCTILAATDGDLGMDLTSEGETLTSALPYGAPATVTILATSPSFVNVGAPTLTASGAGYNPTGQVLEVRYLGAGVLNTVDSGGWLTTPSSRPATSLLGAIVTLDNQLTNAVTGFPSGTYTTRTVVTCSASALY